MGGREDEFQRIIRCEFLIIKKMQKEGKAGKRRQQAVTTVRLAWALPLRMG